MQRKNISSGAPWEAQVGYSRAVRIGNVVEVSGTVAQKDGEIQGIGDPYEQTRIIIQIIEKALLEAGASLQDVVRTRIFVKDMQHWPEIGRAHGEAFGEIRPASSMIQIQGLIDPDMLVEIEATAVIGE